MAQKDADKSTKGKKKSRISAVRHVVQVVVLLIFIAPLLCVGWLPFGLTSPDTATMTTPSSLVYYGSLSASSIGPLLLEDPFATLQVIAASKQVTASMALGAIVVVLVYGALRGRAFCGWICPVNLLCEIVDCLRKRLKIEVCEQPIPRHVKLWIALAVLVLSALISVPLYETFNPIGAINKLIIFGSTTGIFTLIAIIVAELFWGHRVWCRSLCPLGGFYEALGKFGFVRVRIDHSACIGCEKCKAACLASPEILDAAIAGTQDAVHAGDCMVCGKCVDVCPTQALAMKLVAPQFGAGKGVVASTGAIAGGEATNAATTAETGAAAESSAAASAETGTTVEALRATTQPGAVERE